MSQVHLQITCLRLCIALLKKYPSFDALEKDKTVFFCKCAHFECSKWMGFGEKNADTNQFGIGCFVVFRMFKQKFSLVLVLQLTYDLFHLINNISNEYTLNRSNQEQ